MVRALCRHWRGCVTGLGLILLAGCAGHFLVQREPWRKEAELACLKSGAVRETGTIVRIEPINGPGMCGADFPLKVAALGEQTLMSYSDLRPPAEVPTAAPQRWPIANAPATGPASPSRAPQERTFANPLRPAPVQRQPLTPSQSGVQANAHASDRAGAPMPIVPPQHAGSATNPGNAVPPEQDYARATPSGPRRPSVFDPPSEPAFDDEEALAPRANTRRSPYPMPQRTEAMPERTVSAMRPAPAVSPVALGQSSIAAFGPVEIKPAATLACPMVSALDRWIVEAVQPAARRWFRQPVVEIRQISAYSCRGMNAQPGARISEHAFGNALDISSFALADGRRITVKNGWRGSPEEQGFLRDVQGAACEMFNTVLAPGSNRFHYDHFHFDLMRRRSGNRICNPDQISGEVVAARVARERGYAFQSPPGVTGSVGRPQAKSRAAQNASLGGRPKANAKAKRNILDDDDWIEDDGPRPAD